MKTFHHGGRIGDLIYALWTVKKLGGGKLYISDYHKGNWDLNIADQVADFVVRQPYIYEIELIKHKELPKVDYDLQKAEDDFNPHMFPYFDKFGPWPGNTLIAERYAVHFGLTFDFAPWITNIGGGKRFDIVFNCPLRRSIFGLVRWGNILHELSETYDVLIVGKENMEEWRDAAPNAYFTYGNFINTADNIARSKLFLGAISSCYVVAESIGMKRFTEHANGCFNVTTMEILNNRTDEDIMNLIRSSI